MQSSQHLRILIVDEHVPSLVILSNVLRARGHTCENARCATSAIARVRTFRPEVVLYEWNLRDGRGLGLARSIRRAAVGFSPLIIALSTLDEPEDFRRNEEIDEYVTKPFRVERIEELLRMPTLVGVG